VVRREQGDGGDEEGTGHDSDRPPVVRRCCRHIRQDDGQEDEQPFGGVNPGEQYDQGVHPGAASRNDAHDRQVDSGRVPAPCEQVEHGQTVEPDEEVSLRDGGPESDRQDEGHRAAGERPRPPSVLPAHQPIHDDRAQPRGDERRELEREQ